MPTLPEDRVLRLSKLNYYFTILPKKPVGTIFTVCVAGADSLRIWEKVNSLARIGMHREHPNKKIVRDVNSTVRKGISTQNFYFNPFCIRKKR